jgi:hypothetical protein
LEKLSSRNLKKKVLELLRSDDFELSLKQLEQLPGRLVINTLLSLLMDHDELTKWRAVTGIGLVVSRLSDQDIEAARVIMRRLMWSLNDESGGIGWGAPEAMSEIMACSPRIADEYHSILISYLNEEGNFLEYEALQKGLLWGVARLAAARPDLMRPAAIYLDKYLESKDPSIRAFSGRSFRLLGAEDRNPLLNQLLEDHAEFKTFFNNEFSTFKVSELIEKVVHSAR